MFSLSRIHGALGDQGQNYKTLSFLAEKMEIKGGSAQALTLIWQNCWRCYSSRQYPQAYNMHLNAFENLKKLFIAFQCRKVSRCCTAVAKWSLARPACYSVV